MCSGKVAEEALREKHLEKHCGGQGFVPFALWLALPGPPFRAYCSAQVTALHPVALGGLTDLPETPESSRITEDLAHPKTTKTTKKGKALQWVRENSTQVGTKA